MTNWLSDLLRKIPVESQCCDADAYMGLGYQCSLSAAKCWDSLHPMGAVLWFSVPFRLNLPAASILVAHFLLLLISSALAGTWLWRTLESNSFDSFHRILLRAGVFLLALCIHGVFFRAVIFTSLADAPAGLMALIAVWLILLVHQGSETTATAISEACMLAASGVLIGLACWIRVFYLYPLLLSLLVGALFAFTRPYRRRASLWLLLAMAPVLIQYGTTFARTGTLNYIAPVTGNYWTAQHLTSSASGYDTLVPQSPAWISSLETHLVASGHLPAELLRRPVVVSSAPQIAAKLWSSRCEEGGLVGSLKRADIINIGCVVTSRVNFYLGSFASKTYLAQAEDRRFSWMFLAMNGVALGGAILFLAVLGARVEATQVVAITFLILSFVQAVLIIPEQRFVIVCQSALWIFGMAGVIVARKELRVAWPDRSSMADRPPSLYSTARAVSTIPRVYLRLLARGVRDWIGVNPLGSQRRSRSRDQDLSSASVPRAAESIVADRPIEPAKLDVVHDGGVLSGELRLILFAAFFGVMAFGYELTNFTLSIDEELQTFQRAGTDWLGQDRWATYLLVRLIMPESILPFLPTFLAITFLVISSVVFLSIIRGDREARLVFCCLFMTFPAHAYYMQFNTFSFAVAAGFALAFLSIRLLRSYQESYDWRSLALASLCIAFCIGIYQSLLSVWVCALSLYWLWDTLSNREKVARNGALLRLLLSGGAAAIGGVLGAKILAIASRRLAGAGSMEYLEGFVGWGNHSLDVIGRRLWNDVSGHLGGSGVYGGGTIWIIWPAIALILYRLVRERNGVRRWEGVAALAAVIASPFVLSVILGWPLPLRSMLGLPVMVAGLCYVAVQFLKPAMRYAVLGIALLIAVSNSYSTTRLFYSDHLVGEADRNLAREISIRVHSLGIDFSTMPRVPIAFVGVREIPDGLPIVKSETFGASYFFYDGPNQYRLEHFLKIQGMRNFAPADIEMMKKATRYSLEMSVWPNADAVRLVDGMIVVKLGEPTEMRE
jgi:hypothetical protein